jgi:hypothetical protein
LAIATFISTLFINLIGDYSGDVTNARWIITYKCRQGIKFLYNGNDMGRRANMPAIEISETTGSWLQYRLRPPLLKKIN